MGNRFYLRETVFTYGKTFLQGKRYYGNTFSRETVFTGCRFYGKTYSREIVFTGYRFYGKPFLWDTAMREAVVTETVFTGNRFYGYPFTLRIQRRSLPAASARSINTWYDTKMLKFGLSMAIHTANDFVAVERQQYSGAR